MDLGKFFSLKYLFDLTVGPWQEYGFFVFIGSIVIFALGVLAKIIESVAPVSDIVKRFLAKISSLLMTIGGLSLFAWFARQQRMPIFSARFWWVVLLVIGLVWLFFIIKNIVKFKKNKEQFLEKKKVYHDYLPGKK